MEDQTSLTRRVILRSLGAASATAVLGGCMSSRTDGGSSSPSSVVPATTAGPTATPGWNELRGNLKGQLLMADQSGFAAVAHGYNPRYDGRSPAAVALCASAPDVAACVRFATDTATPFSLRSGGHSYTGWSNSAGMVVDVSAMAGIQIDKAQGIARIGAGAKLIDVYQVLGGAGFGVAAGSCPSVGIAGLTLGGGLGVLSRAWGLTSDSLRAAEVVLGDGRVVQADAQDNSDLFWALRGGGGGSFGAVTSFDLALRPAPTVQAFFLRFDYAAAAQVLDAWQRWAPNADHRLWSTLHLLAVPSTGAKNVSVAGTWIGPAGDLDGILDGFVGAVGSRPTSRSHRSHSYQSAMLLNAGCETFEPCHLKPAGSLGREPGAATSSMLPKPLDSNGIGVVLERVNAGLDISGAKEVGVAFDSLGGAVAEPASAATAFVHREAIASMQYTATWTESEALRSPAPMDAYVQAFRAAMTPWCADAAYVNYQDASIQNYGQAYWGANYGRLQQVKAMVDPHGVFTFPQAVKA